MNPKTIKAVWELHSDRYKTRILAKRRSPLMWIASFFVPMSRSAFMTRYATTIGRRIYLPFVPGESHEYFPTIAQLLLAAHEHTHVVQWRRVGRLRYWFRYATSTRWRALYEAESYAAEYEVLVDHKLSPALWPSPERRVESLRAYGCTEEDISAALLYLITGELP